MKVGKYEFNDKQQALNKINNLGQGHNHSVVIIGYTTITDAIYNEDGEMIQDSVLSEMYAVDVLWCGIDNHPYGWKTYSVTPSNPLHSFLGVNNEKNKI